MLRKVLIANRGEIALRVLRSARRLGIRTVGVYSDADRKQPHVALCDESVRIGGPLPAESYLNGPALIGAARSTGCDSLHPGYGFLSENASFARACAAAGIKFVGPSATTLDTTGNKIECKRLAREQGVPVIPSSVGALHSAEEAVELAERFGYPVLLKSSFGGGGRGIREARNARETSEGFGRATEEARNAFGRAEIYIEKLIHPARHIEVQILADEQGNAVHLGERECSIQRRHQKLIELTPSPAVNDALRARLGEYALRVARAVQYTNSGTVEFLLDGEGDVYFMEVNSRLQGEHPITEMVTGVDLVAEQLRVASGEPISFSQSEVHARGSAFEVRVNAENPLVDFAPDTGTVSGLHLPGGTGIRVDSALYEGWTVPEYYDSLLAKLIAWGKDFEEARGRLEVALSEFAVRGIATTLPLYREIVREERFQRWDLSTDYLADSQVVERLRHREQAEKRGRAERAATVAGYLFARGLHRTEPIEEGPGTRRTRGPVRYFDAL